MDDDDEILMRDLSPEEMAQGMSDSTRYVARTFLEKKHYQKIHQSMSNNWDRLHSLSSALKLMETYGVHLTEAEEKKLAGMDEGQQINMLVQKMPQQSNDQFQHFFLQLQLLVSTAMRVRRSLEEGRPDEVESALDDANTTGIASYILEVAIVQAGSEVRTLKTQFAEWTREADSKMGRLLRGQQDNLTAQKQLAIAESELARQNCEQTSKTAKVVMNFSASNDKACKQMIVQAWGAATKQLRLEAVLREEYADRLQDLEDNLAKWKNDQVGKCQNLMLKKIQQDQLAAIGLCYDAWKKDVENEVFLRENGDKLAALEEKLANTKSSQKENATKVLNGMATASEAGLIDSCFKGWVQVRMDTIKGKLAYEARIANESKLDQFTKNKSEEAKYVVSSFAGASETGLLHAVMNGWMDVWAEKKQEAEIAEKMYKSKQNLDSFSDRNKATTGSLMNRASEHIKNMLLIRVLNSWKLDSRVERTVKFQQAKIDAKRGQLVGVQQMFRKFANELEGGLKSSSGQDSSRVFDNVSKQRRLSKGDKMAEGSVSLPDIKQSGRGKLKPLGSHRSGGGKTPLGSQGARTPIGSARPVVA